MGKTPQKPEKSRPRAPRNRTLRLSVVDRARYGARLLRLDQAVQPGDILDRTICQDLFEVLPWLPCGFVDLLVLDPPYNKSKTFEARRFRKLPDGAYAAWLESWLPALLGTLAPTASAYVCSEWSSSAAVLRTLEKYLVVRNRITWERDKGRGARRNWKNVSEDIWFCTVGDAYSFDVDAVKLKRRVLAPYTDHQGAPKDWHRADDGDFRLTCPSNLWVDVTVPFWSMPENTDHPTQKPEKLIAKLILASSRPGDVVLDPFLGSGTTSVVARKLGRRFVGIEWDESYCQLAEKRLELAASDPSIQGYEQGVFWERNALAPAPGRRSRKRSAGDRAPRRPR